MDRYQLAAARGMLGWSLKELSKRTHVTVEAINKFERGGVDNPRKSTIQALRDAFESEGIEFIEQSGIRRRDNSLIEFSGEDSYQKLIEHALASLKNRNQEMWVLFGEDSKSTENVVDVELRLRKKGIKMKFLVSDANSYLRYPLKEYRAIPERFFYNNPIVIYDEFVGMFYPDQMKSEIRKHKGLAACMANLASLIYNHSKIPLQTTCEDGHD